MQSQDAAPTDIQLSIAVIARNAADALGETLESCAGLGDEIVILDTGSTDNTRDVALAAQARWIPFVWNDDFSAARNFAASQCRGQWILWLDAGEHLSAADAAALRHFVRAQAQTTSAYLFVVRRPVPTGDIAAEQIAQVRLVPRLPNLSFAGRVRETLRPSLKHAGLTLTGLPWRIERSRCELAPQVAQAKAERNLHLAMLEMHERGPHAELLNCRGEAWLTLGDSLAAAQHFRQAIAVSQRGSSAMLAGYYGLIAALEKSDQGTEAQLQVCSAGLEVFPLDAQLLTAAGGFLCTQGRLDMALRAFQTACRFGQIDPEVTHLDGCLEIAASCYAQTLVRLGRAHDASTALQEDLQRWPESTRLRRQWMALLVQQGDHKRALAQVDALPPETPYREALKSAVRGACLAAKKQWIPARAYLEDAYRHGSRDIICLEWLTRLLVEAGHWDAAAPVLAQWRRVDPANPQLHQALDRVSTGMLERLCASAAPAGIFGSPLANVPAAASLSLN